MAGTTAWSSSSATSRALTHSLPEFRDPALLQRALTHASYANEHVGEAAAALPAQDNERMEFLGDAILDFVAAAWLYRTHADADEGRLTRLRAALVRTTRLARFAEAIDLSRLLLLGKGEAEAGRARPSILADAFEALLGALYLDQGLAAVQAFLEPLLEEALPSILQENSERDAKTLLQEWSQSLLGVTPRYRLAGASGPDHARVFRVEVWLGDVLAAAGEGTSKQGAEQSAAREAIAREDALARAWLTGSAER